MKILKLLLLTCIVFNSNFSFTQNSPAPIKLVQFVLSPNHSDWNYNLKEEALVKITVLKYGIPIPNTEITYEFGNDQMVPDKSGTLTLKSGIGEINIGSLKQPGFKQLKVKTTIDGHTYKDQVKVGFSPFNIKPTVKNPKDFDDFWKQAIETNKSIPSEPVITHKPEYSTPTVDVYLVRLQNYKKGKYIYGYLSKPKDHKKHPVLFHPPGAGVKKIHPVTAFADQGFISFTTEIHGINPELTVKDYKNISNAIGDYWSINLDDKDQYYYKSVYLGCLRAIDFLTSLPEFDGKNVVVTGGSQGGALSMVTAALDTRVTAVSAFYPALCDNSGYVNHRAGGWPHMFSSKYQLTTPKKLNTMQYYDVVNFAKRIRIPGFYSTGYNDNTCAPSSVLSAFNSINAKKEIVITPISGHWRFSETNEKSIKWLKQTCGID
ncbi:acetylxylan esterase [Aestuariibaculum sp. YM273]|uniref:acetylxylan esterase n=1 Tax=Aestuariibaculum sp. YM273 TaxID=3070659 RepID=UPI0027DBDE37|nr:acetylxylan esterase [Aestuariibaculum sp. YM273]WMI64958.1 acetylxylan esterase [Aestuariibaculum sp. YM273]